MCGTFTPAAGSAGSSRTTAGTSPSPGSSSSSLDVEQHLHPEAHAEHRPFVRGELAHHRVQPGRRSPRMHAPNAPTPGTTAASARAASSGAEVTSARRRRVATARMTLRRFPMP